MKHTLVGHTGLVGGNLAATHRFNGLYNSKNIAESFGADNGLVVYSGMTAEKFLANADPAADLAVAQNAMENIRRMRPQRLVLVSTVDVYPTPLEVYEDTPIDDANAPAYGKNRHALEGWVRDEYPDALILRLPGLYGRGLKKNFIFDLIHLTPGTLSGQKYAELAEKSPLVKRAYAPDDKGFYRLQPQNAETTTALRAFYEGNDFSALSFTDSRSVFQFYNLALLWGHIEKALAAGLTLLNLAAQPVAAAEVFAAVRGKSFENHTPNGPVRYDMRTRHATLLGGDEGYLQAKDAVLRGIVAFANAQ